MNSVYYLFGYKNFKFRWRYLIVDEVCMKWLMNVWKIGLFGFEIKCDFMVRFFILLVIIG